MTKSDQGMLPDFADGYNSRYKADYYASMVQVPKFFKDKDVYFDAYEGMVRLRPLQDQIKDEYIVLDVGTGTGRVIRDLVTAIHSRELDLTKSRFIGVDISQYMVDHAAVLSIAPKGARVSWVLGDAFNLRAVSPFDHPTQYADLIIFAFSSICHFVQPGQPEKFLAQVAQVLRPGTGRAYLSVDGRFLGQKETLVDDEENQDWSQGTRSPVYAGIVYREGKYVCEMKDGLLCIEFDIDVVQTSPDAKDRSLETVPIRVSCRLWEEEEIPRIAAAVGLKLVETVQHQGEFYYVFQKPVIASS